MENAYPGSHILVVTLTSEESKRVEAQSEKETLREATGVLRDIFGPEVPTADRILVPPWWNNHFQRRSYNNYPIFATHQDFVHIKEERKIEKRRESVGEEGEEEDQKLEIGEGFETNNNKIKIPVSAGVRRSLAIISVLPTPKPASTYVASVAPIGPIFSTGEHTNERFNGYVHGEYVLLTGAFPRCGSFCICVFADPFTVGNSFICTIREWSGIQQFPAATQTKVLELLEKLHHEYKGLKLQEAVEWVVKNRLDEGQVWMIAVSSEGEVAYGFNINAMFRGCATEDGFMEVGIWE
ncbi:hypothetical protein Sjap_001390 [Stephania japonica]|uniref:Amine oxidase domain-containing protein n=1 Tax=Stephania japonica TaxID=461633 RepID=A0AAP0PT95_9MAGN